MIDPSKVTKVDILKLERTSPELYYCIRQWKEGALTWEQAANVAIILLLEQNDKLRDELIKTYDYSPLKMISLAMSEVSESINKSEIDSSAHENILAVQRFTEAQQMYECGLITNDEMKIKMRGWLDSEKQQQD